MRSCDPEFALEKYVAMDDDVSKCDTQTLAKSDVMKQCRHWAKPPRKSAAKTEKEAVSPMAAFVQAVVGLDTVRRYLPTKDNPNENKFAMFGKEALAVKEPYNATADIKGHF